MTQETPLEDPQAGKRITKVIDEYPEFDPANPANQPGCIVWITDCLVGGIIKSTLVKAYIKKERWALRASYLGGMSFWLGDGCFLTEEEAIQDFYLKKQQQIKFAEERLEGLKASEPRIVDRTENVRPEAGAVSQVESGT